MPSLKKTSLVLATTTLLGSILIASPFAQAVQPRVVVDRPSVLPPTAVKTTSPSAINFDVLVRTGHEAALTEYLANEYNATSPLYRHFLTPTTFARTFGASPATLRNVTSYFTSRGATLRSVAVGDSLLELRATPKAIAHIFNAPVVTVRTRTGELASQFTRAATLPASIARDVRSVAGLSSVVTPHTQLAVSHVVPRVSTTPTTPSACAPATSTSATTPGSLYGYDAQQLATLYGLSAAWSKGNVGAGQTIAAYELASYDPADTAVFFHCYGLSPQVTTINVDGGSGSAYNDEATLDIEDAGVLAPGAAIDVYQGPQTNSGPTDTYAQIANDDTATIVTTSWGDCENDPTGDVVAEQAIFEQMAAQGQTVIAAAGDNGSNDCTGIVNGLGPTVDDPSSQPFVTGVGGLSVSNITYVTQNGTSSPTQTVWNDNAGSGGGGGYSQIWGRPTWQTGDGVATDETARMVPDISLDADPNSGFVQYYTGQSNGVATCSQTNANCQQGWWSIGGTSVGAPMMAALVAVAAQGCSVSRLGFINPTLYQDAALGQGIVDVTTGNNDTFSNRSGYGGGQYYPAGVGYDLAAGLGSPSPSLVNDLCPPSVNVAKSSLALSATSVRATQNDRIEIALRDVNANPLLNTVLHVTATAAQPTGTVTIDNDPSSATSPGVAQYNVTSNDLGDIALDVSANLTTTLTVTISEGATVLFTSSVKVTLPKPLAPTIAKVTPGATSIVVVVAPPASTSPAISSYQVSVNGGTTWIAFSPVTRTVTVAHLRRATTYAVIVRASNQSGTGPTSAAKTVTTLH